MTYTIRLNPGEAVQVSIWRRGNEVNLDVGEAVPVDIPPVEPPPSDEKQRMEALLQEMAALLEKLRSGK